MEWQWESGLAQESLGLPALSLSLYASISRFNATCSRAWPPQIRSDRHWHAFGIRSPDAFRSGGRLPVAHHQEMPPEIHHPRIALVPTRGNQHPVPERTGGDDLG